MKTYKQFMFELATNVPVISVEKHNSDLNSPKTVFEINKNLKFQLNKEFESFSDAISKIKKILSMYSIEIPDIGDHHQTMIKGDITIPVNQVSISGEKHSGIVTSTKDSDQNFKKLNIKYNQGNLGYKVIAKIQN